MFDFSQDLEDLLQHPFEIDSEIPEVSFVGRGANRLVFSIDTSNHTYNEDVVLKVALGPTGRVQNKQAKEWSDKLSDSFVCPIVDSHSENKWIIQYMCEDVSDLSQCYGLLQSFHQNGLKYQDSILDNVGWYKGSVVFRDLASISKL